MSLRLSCLAIGLVVVGACGSKAARTTDAAVVVDGVTAADSALIPDGATGTDSSLIPDGATTADGALTADGAQTAADAVDAGDDIAGPPLCLGQPMGGAERSSFGECPDPSKMSACMTCQGLADHPECYSLCSFYSICWECSANGWVMSLVGCPRSCGDGGAIQPGAIDATNDASLASGSETGVDGGLGLPHCTQTTTSARIAIEIPSGKITAGAVYGSGPSDVWVATLPDHKIARWNGSAWAWVAELADSSVLAIAGSGSSDVWLGGTGGALWHWDGNALTRANSNTTLDIQQIAVVASGQAFALAFVPVHSGSFDLLRLEGTEWSVVGQPSAPLDLYFLPHDLYAPTATEAWGVLYQQAFHYQDNAFGPVAVPDVSGVWGTDPNNVWFGKDKWDGQRIVQPLGSGWGPIWGTGPTDMWIGTIHWDGQTATDYVTSGLGLGVAALRGLSTTDVWATTLYGGIVHFDGSQTWKEVVADPDFSSNHVYGLAEGIWQVGSNALWIAGPYNQIYLYDGGALVPIPDTGTPPTNDLLGVWGSSTKDLWAVGNNGAILHGDGTGWTQGTSPTTNTLRAVSGSAANDVWAVGDAGTVAHWNGASWSATPSNTSTDLFAVWATANYVVAVGANGTIIADDGKGFASQTSGATATLRGVWGRSPSDVYAADGSNLFIYDGKAWTQKTIAGDTCVSGAWGTADGVFADGYYYDGTVSKRLVPTYPTPDHNGAVVCLSLDGAWASSATDLWSVGGLVHVATFVNDFTREIYRFNGECIETVASNLFSSNYHYVSAPVPGMRAIFGLGEHDLWAVGELGMIAHIQR